MGRDTGFSSHFQVGLTRTCRVIVRTLGQASSPGGRHVPKAGVGGLEMLLPGSTLCEHSGGWYATSAEVLAIGEKRSGTALVCTAASGQTLVVDAGSGPSRVLCAGANQLRDSIRRRARRLRDRAPRSSRHPHVLACAGTSSISSSSQNLTPVSRNRSSAAISCLVSLVWIWTFRMVALFPIPG